MDTNDLKKKYPGNSKLSKVAPIRATSGGDEVVEERKPRAQRAIAVRKKRTLAQTVAQTLAGDETRNVGTHVLYDILIPAAKNTIQEMFSTGLEMILFGEDRPRRSSRDRSERSVVSYDRMYDRHERRQHGAQKRFGLDEIFFRKGDEADDVLEALCDQAEKYGQASVADFFELAGVDTPTWIHYKWGWTNLKRAYCTHTRSGYAIILPDPVELD